MERAHSNTVGERTRQEEHDGLEGVEEQAHRLADDPAQRHDERNNEQRDLLCAVADERMSACHSPAGDETVLVGTTRTILEPTATPSESVILSLTDTVTAVTCSRGRRQRAA